MSYHSRRILSSGASRKRKEREVIYSSTSPKPLIPLTAVSRAVSVTNRATTSFKAAEKQQPVSSNRLLAGYMAYEFLTKGTFLGQKFDPARAEAVPVNTADPKRIKQIQAQPSQQAELSGKSKPQCYAEVSHLLRSDGVHIPGVVNPTQLARWLQLWVRVHVEDSNWSLLVLPQHLFWARPYHIKVSSPPGDLNQKIRVKSLSLSKHQNVFRFRICHQALV